jgi:hypothetical protein
MSETKRPDAYKSDDGHGIGKIANWFKGSLRSLLPSRSLILPEAKSRMERATSFGPIRWYIVTISRGTRPPMHAVVRCKPTFTPLGCLTEPCLCCGPWRRASDRSCRDDNQSTPITQRVPLPSPPSVSESSPRSGATPPCVSQSPGHAGTRDGCWQQHRADR